MTDPRSLSARRTLLVSLVVAGAASASGCHVWNRLWGKDSIDLSKADVKSMSVDIRKDRKTICPREQVQMAIFADAVLDGEKDKKSYETWAGKAGANKNDKLDFVDFAFHSDQGAFDKDGWFQPNANLLATTDKQFEIKTVFKKQPDKFSFTTKYKPDYQCIKGGGRDGQSGGSGDSGPGGQEGQDGQSGSDSQAGGSGTSGGQGGPGGDGSAGGAGPHIVAYATMVKTPYYDKLVAIKLTGDMDDFLLAPVDAPIMLHATGGPGGSGGAGGSGGRGGHGGSGNPGGQGGQGGQGGNGGRGGNGGPGGTVELVFDSAFPDLAHAIQADVSGGAGGSPGAGGGGGSRGSGGSGITPSGSQQSAPSGTDGGDGPAGAQGSSGQQGPAGRSAAHPGRVADQFANLEGVSLLDDSAAPAAPPPDAAPPAKPTPAKKKQAKGKQ